MVPLSESEPLRSLLRPSGDLGVLADNQVDRARFAFESQRLWSLGYLLFPATMSVGTLRKGFFNPQDD